jgi:hypothetical protein
MGSDPAVSSTDDRMYLSVAGPARSLTPDDYELTLRGVPDTGHSREIGT